VQYNDRDAHSDLSRLAHGVARTARALRTARGWSLDALSARSGVSKGVLVALEQGRANPNLATLVRLTEAFGVPLTHLLQMEEEPTVRLVSPDQAVVLWRGEAGGSGTLLAGSDPPHGVEVWRWVMEPGEVKVGGAHAPGTHEVVSVESGRLTLVVDEGAYEIGAGGSASFSAWHDHRYENQSRRQVRFVMVVTVPSPEG